MFVLECKKFSSPFPQTFSFLHQICFQALCICTSKFNWNLQFPSWEVHIWNMGRISFPLHLTSLYLCNKDIKVMPQISLGCAPVVNWCVWDLLTTTRAGLLRSKGYLKVPETAGLNSLLIVDISVFGHRFQGWKESVTA